MATERVSKRHAVTTEQGTEQPPGPESGSVWWVELVLGAVCALTSVVFALGHTAVGPFSGVTVVYPTVVSAAYLAVASVLAVVFVGSGYRRSPWSDSSGGMESDENREAP